MADFDGSLVEGPLAFVQVGVVQTFAPDPPPGIPSPKGISVVVGAGTLDVTGESLASTIPIVDFDGAQALDPGQFFFERVWAIPGRIELGNIITSVTQQIEIYNAFREVAKSLVAATANAGPGVSFDGLPALPASIAAQTGVVFDVVVSTSGPPEIDGTLDFTVSGTAISISITGSRVIMFPYEPETPIAERLEFKTDILKSVDGSEQRVSVRKHPRQVFEVVFRLEEGSDRRTLHTLIAGFQSGVLGLPVWFEGRQLEADASSGSSTITVDTRFADFRVGALAILWTSPTDYEALEIDSFTSTSLTFTSPTSRGFDAADTLVMPLRLTRTEETVDGRKYIKNLDEFRFRFTVLDNEANIADTGDYTTLSGKVVLDDANWSGNQPAINDSFFTRITRIDNEMAPLSQYTDWNIAQLESTKGFIANTPEELWKVRQLAHALRGSQVSFYIPTFYADVATTSPLGTGSNQITIEHIGYTDFVNAQDPMGALWVLKTDGTSISRYVTATEEIDASTERLTVDSVWGADVTLDEIDRISFLRLARIADDTVRFEHIRPGVSKIVMATIGVQQ